MTQITGGRVRFSKTIQLAQYEPATAEAEFTFGVTEGDDETAISLKAAMAARRLVEATLADKLGQVEVAGPKPALDQAETPRRKRNSAPPPAVVETTVKEVAAQVFAKPVEDDLGLDSPEPAAERVPETEAGDDLDLGLDDAVAPPAAEVTDVELTTAVARRNGELIRAYQDKEGEAAGKKGTLLIRALLKDEFGDAKIRELPQSQRHNFIERLNALAYVKA